MKYAMGYLSWARSHATTVRGLHPKRDTTPKERFSFGAQSLDGEVTGPRHIAVSRYRKLTARDNVSICEIWTVFQRWLAALSSQFRGKEDARPFCSENWLWPRMRLEFNRERQENHREVHNPFLRH